jgi:hypothetical protein
VIDEAEASRLLAAATTKDEVGTVLDDWLRSTFGCGLVLVVKNEMAMGWKGFFPDADDLVEAVAVPLGKPSMFSLAYESKAPFAGRPPEGGAKQDGLFWRVLRCVPPAEVLVCPVVLGKRVVNLLYAHSEDASVAPSSVASSARLVAAGGAEAYARIIRRDANSSR